MAVAREPLLAAVLLFISPGLLCASPPLDCPQSCTCQRATLLNCSSSSLSLVPEHIQDSVTELELSHNLLDSVTLHWPHRNLKNVWLGNNSITHLSLCIERNLGSQYVRDRRLHRSRPWSKRRCVSWAPALQLLSVERNQLEQLPEGLEGSGSLQVLQLSFNRISAVQPEDLIHLQQLKELHLQHNLITILHPQVFQDLAQLRVLDLSFNMLTSLHPLMYLSLQTIGVDVKLDGNSWHCDCSMRNLRRRMAYDSSRGLQTWSIMCASPSILSSKDLLQLGEDDLNCFNTENRRELHQDVTVYSGSEMLLSCLTQDSVWWTPSGQASVRQPQAGLLINDITKKDTGLYVCVSEEHEVVSVFNLQISKMGGARRKTRSLPRTKQQIIPQDTPNRTDQERNQTATSSDLVLAVCLSVFITFLVAFILGVLARPYINILWTRVANKKSSSETSSVPPVEQRQYDNEAYSNGEAPEEIVIHRERRVTFSREDNNVQYYDTLASGNQEHINNDGVAECEAAEAEDMCTAGDLRNENTLQQSTPEADPKDGRHSPDIIDQIHKIECEHIPDTIEVEERRSLSLHSDSSLSDKVLKKDQMTKGDYTVPRFSQLAEDSIQQRADFSTAIKEGRCVIPGFSSEPFPDWSPYTNPLDPDLSQENDEQFEFSDSVQSTSARSSSVFGSLNDLKQIAVPTLDKQKRHDMSSSSSYVSEDEPTQYTVNPDQEEEDDIEMNHKLSEFTNRPEHSFSSHSSDSDGESKHAKVDLNCKQCLDIRALSQPTESSSGDESVDQKMDNRLDIKAPSPSPDSSSSSSSEDETCHTERPGKVDIRELPLQKPLGHSSCTRWPTLDLEHIPRIKRCLDIRVASPAFDLSSSSDSEDETTSHTEKQRPVTVNIPGLQYKESQTTRHDPESPWPALNLEYIPRIKRCLDIKAPSPASDLSSSSDSEDKITSHTEKQRPVTVNIPGLQYKESQTTRHDPESPWPALNLEYIPRIKRCLDIKAPSPASDLSSSSDSEDKITSHTEKQRPVTVNIPGLQYKESQTTRHDPESPWPALNLEYIPRIKRCLDIKAPSPASDLSSSSDSEDKITSHTEKQRPVTVNIPGLQYKESQTTRHDPESPWPALNLEYIPRIKRCLDIKAPSPASDLSSSSDSEDKITSHTEKQRPVTVNIPGLQYKESQTTRHDPESPWPALNLEYIPRIKRCLDIKAPSPASDLSSSSDSEDKITSHTEKQRPVTVNIPGLQYKESQTTRHDPESPWPALNLEYIPRIKRCLDIKAPSPASDLSSSSDSEDKITSHTEKQRPVTVNIPGLQYKESQTTRHDPESPWPALNLEYIPRIKRCLDIKAPSPASDLSSSSDSEDKITSHTEKQRPVTVNIPGLQYKESQTTRHDPESPWPALNLEYIPRIKRCLDIKAPSPASDLSSSSDSEDKITSHTEKQRPVTVNIPGLQYKESQTTRHDPESPWPALNLEYIPRIKRCLDIKAPSPASDLSSSSDSEDKITSHTEKQRPVTVNIPGLQYKESQTTRHDPESPWPALNLEYIPRIKRCLDIKAPSPASDLSSSSDSEDKITSHTEKQRPVTVNIPGLQYKESQTTRHDPESPWPALNLEYIPRIKRCLDIKAPSPASDLSSSSDSEDKITSHTEKQRPVTVNIPGLQYKESQTTRHDPESPWPALNLEYIPRIKRCLDIKAPSPASDLSSSSDSEDKITSHTEKQRPVTVNIPGLQYKESQTTRHDPESPWPALNLEYIPRIKRCLDIKAPSPAFDSSLARSSISVGSQQSGSHSSRSDSEDEKGNHNAKVAAGVSAISKTSEKVFTKSPKFPAISISHSPITDHNIKLEKYTVIADDLEDKPTNDNINTTPEITPELQSRWATMNLGISRFRKRLEITSRTHEPPNLPSSPPPESPSSSSSESETGNKVSRTRQKRRGVEIQESDSYKDASLKYTSQSKTEEMERKDSTWPRLSFTNVPHVKRSLNIRAQRESSSSSNSEDETIDHIVTDLSLGVPRIKRCLNIKAPVPSNPLSPCSESKNEVPGYIGNQITHASYVSGMTDSDSLITYKRLIMKTSLPPGNSFPPSGKTQTTDHAEMLTVQDGPFHRDEERNPSLAPRRIMGMSFDKCLKQSSNMTDVDLPPEIRWTGVGRHLSDLSICSHSRRLDEGLSPQQAPTAKPELPQTDSSSIRSHDRITQFGDNTEVTLMHKYSSLSHNSVSRASNRGLDKSDTLPSSTNEILRTISEEKRERKGLSALKAMSTERQKWDTEDEPLNKYASPLFDNHGPQADISFSYRRSEKEMKPLPKPLTQLHLSPISLNERKVADMPYSAPRYGRHDTGALEPPQEPPPPIPATAPPDEEVGFT
uniref:uncharacterized protein lrrc66 n=1 Tax=Monopterus albus TaxID=43700 RepID=UPI0009B4ACDD|nr:leucine-rich repeat-containing protein 66 [Monopterus albus]